MNLALYFGKPFRHDWFVDCFFVCVGGGGGGGGGGNRVNHLSNV